MTEERHVIDGGCCVDDQFTVDITTIHLVDFFEGKKCKIQYHVFRSSSQNQGHIHRLLDGFLLGENKETRGKDNHAYTRISGLKPVNFFKSNPV